MATLRYPSNISSRQAFMIITRHKHEGYTTSQLKSPEKFQYKATVGSSIGLPVPNNLTDSSSIRWSDDFDQSLIGSALKGVKEKASQLGAGKVISEAQLRTGAALEKHSALLFEGVSPKVYTFSWNIIPKTSQEADEVFLIIKEFEEGKLPTLQVGSQFFGSPDIFKIKITGFKGMKFLPCVVTDVRVEYSPNGNFMVHTDGNVPMLVLTVTFSEITSRNRETQQRLR